MEGIKMLAAAGVNVCRLNFSHGTHVSHKAVVDIIKEYNAQNPLAPMGILLDTKGTAPRGRRQSRIAILNRSIYHLGLGPFLPGSSAWGLRASPAPHAPRLFRDRQGGLALHTHAQTQTVRAPTGWRDGAL